MQDGIETVFERLRIVGPHGAADQGFPSAS